MDKELILEKLQILVHNHHNRVSVRGLKPNSIEYWSLVSFFNAVERLLVIAKDGIERKSSMCNKSDFTLLAKKISSCRWYNAGLYTDEETAKERAEKLLNAGEILGYVIIENANQHDLEAHGII